MLKSHCHITSEFGTKRPLSPMNPDTGLRRPQGALRPQRGQAFGHTPGRQGSRQSHQGDGDLDMGLGGPEGRSQQ